MYIKKATRRGDTVEVMLNKHYPGVPVTRWEPVPEEVEVTVTGTDGKETTETQIKDVYYPVMVWTKDSQSWAEFKQMVLRELQAFVTMIESAPAPEDVTADFQA